MSLSGSRKRRSDGGGEGGRSEGASGSNRRRTSVDSRNGYKSGFSSSWDGDSKASFSRLDTDNNGYEKSPRDWRAAPSPRGKNASPLGNTNGDERRNALLQAPGLKVSYPRENYSRRDDGRNARSFGGNRNPPSSSARDGEPAVSSPRGRNAASSQGGEGGKSKQAEGRSKPAAAGGGTASRRQQLPKHAKEPYPQQPEQQQQQETEQVQEQGQEEEKENEQEQEQPPQPQTPPHEGDAEEAEAVLPRHLLGQKPDFEAEGGGVGAGVYRM